MPDGGISWILYILKSGLTTTRSKILHHFEVDGFIDLFQFFFELFRDHLTLVRGISVIQSVQFIIGDKALGGLGDWIVDARQLLVIIFIKFVYWGWDEIHLLLFLHHQYIPNQMNPNNSY